VLIIGEGRPKNGPISATEEKKKERKRKKKRRDFTLFN
jgi:hypothetical protein